MGCVFAEMLLGQPLFPGESGVDQLVEIIKVLGTPSKDNIMRMNPNYTDFKFPQIKPCAWDKIFKSKASCDALDLIDKFLIYNPEERTKPLDVLSHNYFDELRDERAKLPDGTQLPDIFNFTYDEINKNGNFYKKIVPSW